MARRGAIMTKVCMKGLNLWPVNGVFLGWRIQLMDEAD
jgi:hypothetical protein